jgi:hypothetical protein
MLLSSLRACHQSRKRVSKSSTAVGAGILASLRSGIVIFLLNAFIVETALI